MPRLTAITVMPAYNEGDRLASFLRDWATEALRHASPAATALVIDDGSREMDAATQQKAVHEAADLLASSGAPHAVRYIRAPRNQGKGAAIRLGWSHTPADVDWLGFIDADGAVPASEWWRLAGQLDRIEADAVCGSRVKMAGRAVERSLFRHIQGRTFATGVEELFHLGFYDTQCGCKLFRGAALRPILDQLREDRWLLDIEVLTHLRSRQARFVEIPIDCHERGGSSLVFGIDPLKMAVQLVRLRGRLRREGVLR
jgi:dolichyl-phosphate beta-glucosyltransferase